MNDSVKSRSHNVQFGFWYICCVILHSLLDIQVLFLCFNILFPTAIEHIFYIPFLQTWMAVNNPCLPMLSSLHPMLQHIHMLPGLYQSFTSACNTCHNATPHQNPNSLATHILAPSASKHVLLHHVQHSPRRRSTHWDSRPDAVTPLHVPQDAAHYHKCIFMSKRRTELPVSSAGSVDSHQLFFPRVISYC